MAHGGDMVTQQRTYIEEPLPADAVTYAIRMNPWGKSRGDFILEARVKMAATFAKSDPDWLSPKEGDEYGLEIVHTILTEEITEGTSSSMAKVTTTQHGER